MARRYFTKSGLDSTYQSFLCNIGMKCIDVNKSLSLQIHKLLKGLPPIRSLVSVGSGAAKLVSLPVKNYRKDHRLLKGVQRGKQCFKAKILLHL